MKCLAITCYLLLFISTSFAQPLLPYSTVPYFSTDGSDSITFPVISGLNENNYFFRFITKENGHAIGRLPAPNYWFSNNWVDNYAAIPTINQKLLNNSIGKTEQKHYLLSNTLYPNKLFSFKGIFVSNFVNGKWQKPSLLPIKQINYAKVHSFYMTPELDVIIFSMRGKNSFGKEDLYISHLDSGKWSTPQNLGITINSEMRELCPFLSKDRRYLFFSCGSQGSPINIYFSERLYNSWKIWSKPKKLPSPINSDKDEFYFVQTDKNIFYISNKSGSADIYFGDISQENLPLKSHLQLSSDEVKQLLESDIDLELDFAKNSHEISDHNKEILWYIANKVLSKKQIKILLQGSKDLKEDDGYLPIGRTINVRSYLSSLGVENNRIVTKDIGNKGSKLLISFIEH